MSNFLPQKKICIVCEGYEEFDYITRLKSCNVWNPIYSVTAKNVQSIDNIAAVYQNEFQNDNHDLVIVFCDTEVEPYRQFKLLCDKIDKFHNRKIAKDIVFFANPCTMQIILSHFRKVSMDTNSKSKNAKLIMQLTGVAEYVAKKEQRNAINRQIDSQNYIQMKTNILSLGADYKTCPSTNFLKLLENLESSNPSWVKQLAKKIEKD